MNKLEKQLVGLTNEANARLIAAAPDLYEALCYLLETSTGQTHEQWLEAMDMARAAIAKVQEEAKLKEKNK